MPKEIKFIAFYEDAATDKQNRSAVLAAVHKINYINSVLVRNHYKVSIISPSWTLNNNGFYRGQNRRLASNINLKTFHTFGSDIKVIRIFKYLFTLIQLFLYLLFHTSKDEPVMVYHSVILSLPIRAAKFIRKFILILDVEELYQDLVTFSNYNKKSEYKIINKAEKYMFATELLHEKLNLKMKPYTIINGIYCNQKIIAKKEKDGYIHVVYAGNFDPRKGGGLAAVDSAAYLPAGYHVHILGFGTEQETMTIKEEVNKVEKITKAKITFDGSFFGEEYISFIQKCHIGLSTQNPLATFANSSFPSKILSYMSNGLQVISGRAKVVERTKLSKYITFYDPQTPEEIAKAILSVNLDTTINSRELINQLDKEFEKNLLNLLKK